MSSSCIERRHSLTVGLRISVPFAVRPVVTRMTLSFPGCRSVILPSFHLVGCLFSPFTITTSSISKGLIFVTHFPWTWHWGRYSFSHRFQKLCMRYCTYFHRRNPFGDLSAYLLPVLGITVHRLKNVLVLALPSPMDCYWVVLSVLNLFMPPLDIIGY